MRFNKMVTMMDVLATVMFIPIVIMLLFYFYGFTDQNEITWIIILVLYCVGMKLSSARQWFFITSLIMTTIYCLHIFLTFKDIINPEWGAFCTSTYYYQCPVMFKCPEKSICYEYLWQFTVVLILKLQLLLGIGSSTLGSYALITLRARVSCLRRPAHMQKR